MSKKPTPKKPKAKPKSAKKNAATKKQLKRFQFDKKKFFTGLKKFSWRFVVILLFLLVFFIIYLDSLVKDEFKQKAWNIPAKVFARPLDLSLGRKLTVKDLQQELKLLGYRQQIKAVDAGEYEKYENTFVIHLRRFNFWDGIRAEQIIQLVIEQGKITLLKDFTENKAVNFLRLEPMLLGNFFADELEDRQLIQLSDLPESFISVLLNTEDRNFYQHSGVSLSGIARAAWRNIDAGEVVQGGSTITQQLMKNHFLSHKRSFLRKSQEAIMALLTELHYDKDTILQAYINEVYLGQHQKSGIYGFARASEFYFDKPIGELNLSQIALLVGMVKGPSLYNPRRNPDNAIKRRNQVLDQLFKQDLVTEKTYKTARSLTLQVVKKPKLPSAKVPAFLNFVKRELRRDYSLSELHSDGLHLFTSLDPLLQIKTEQALSQRLKSIESSEKFADKPLQGAMIVSDVASGDILALVGDKNPHYAGFNRALDAYRQTGSIIKPFVYLTALKAESKFNLLTPVLDQPFTLTGSDGSVWQPKNHDDKVHGEIELQQGLIHSYNLATARLALDIGVANIVETIRSAGFSRSLPAYPSVALGAKEMSPMEVLQLYQALANDGVVVPVSALIAVQDQKGDLLQRYQRRIKSSLDTQASFAVKYLLTQVTQQGTAQSIGQTFEQTFAGKTGTTNDLRDSWYAGFSRDKLAVVWLGRDDNQPSLLTGASGALQVWKDLFLQLQEDSVELQIPETMSWAYQSINFFADLGDCKKKKLLPFDTQNIPKGYKICEF